MKRKINMSIKDCLGCPSLLKYEECNKLRFCCIILNKYTAWDYGEGYSHFELMDWFENKCQLPEIK